METLRWVLASNDPVKVLGIFLLKLLYVQYHYYFAPQALDPIETSVSYVVVGRLISLVLQSSLATGRISVNQADVALTDHIVQFGVCVTFAVQDLGDGADNLDGMALARVG